MKICFIADASSMHTRRIADYFAENHEVHLVDDHYYKSKNINFHFVDKKFYLAKLSKIRSMVKSINPDILWSIQATYHGFAGALCNIHPFILTPLGSDILFDAERFPHRVPLGCALKKADLIHCIDESIKLRIGQISDCKNKCFVINEGVKISIFKPSKIKPKRITILYMRKIMDSYNSQLIFSVLNQIPKNFIFRFPSDKLVRHQTNNYKPFLWKTDEKYVAKLMQYSDIYVDTLTRTKIGQGITGKTCIEAMSCGLPVVMPDNPMIETYIKHNYNGMIYKKNDVYSLANTIKILVDNPNLRRKLGRNARTFVKNNLDFKKNMKILSDKINVMKT